MKEDVAPEYHGNIGILFDLQEVLDIKWALAHKFGNVVDNDVSLRIIKLINKLNTLIECQSNIKNTIDK